MRVPSKRQLFAHTVPIGKWTITSVITPAAFYFAAFCLLTYPLIMQFSTHVFGGEGGDCLQNVWNVWWVDFAVTRLHQSPWHTDYLHYPYGTSHLCHTPTAVNGFMCIPLHRFLSPVETHNVAVIFSYVSTGVTTFWLARYLTQSYIPSLIAWYLFTFSSFHVCRLLSQLNFMTTEWIPLFVLFWIMFLRRPRISIGVLAALALYLVLISEYNYYFYCLLLAFITLAWTAYQKRDVLFFARKHDLLALTTFMVAVLLTSEPIIISLVRLNASDLTGPRFLYQVL